MRNLLFGVLLVSAVVTGCSSENRTVDADNRTSGNSGNTSSEVSDSGGGKGVDAASPPQGAANQPRTIRDHFMLLPEKYFVLEGCEKEKDENCRKAKLSYLKTFTEVEDTANGYLKAGCDGAQSCIEMTIFKRPDSTYLVALATEAEMIREQYFLDHRNGNWTDVSADVIPNFSRSNFYELPRHGTKVNVFSKKIIEKGQDYEISEKGAKLYELEWKDGRFSVNK